MITSLKTDGVMSTEQLSTSQPSLSLIITDHHLRISVTTSIHRHDPSKDVGGITPNMLGLRREDARRKIANSSMTLASRRMITRMREETKIRIVMMCT